MIDGGEELHYVAAQRIPVAAGEPLAAVERAMGPFAGSVGVAVRNESRLEQGFDDVAERMVHHAVPERCGAYAPVLGFVDLEVGVVPWRVAALDQCGLKVQQTVGQARLERRRRGFTAFSLRSLAMGEQEVVPLADRIEQGICHG